MPTGLPSIDDLIPKKTSLPTDDSSVTQKTAVPLNVSQSGAEEKFGKKMDEIKKKELETEAMRFASQIGVPHVDLKKFPVTHEALKQVPLETAKELGVVCFYADQDELRFGAIDPTLDEVKTLIEEASARYHANSVVYVVSEVSLERVLEMYKGMPTIKAISKDIEITAESLDNVKAQVDDFKTVDELLQKSTTTDIITILLGAALKVDASDIHVEAEQDKVAIRFRLDGILHDVSMLPKDMLHQLLSRIKLTSSLKINITDKPQDGRFTIKLETGDVDVRVSTIPTVFGESVVLRLLMQHQEGISLDGLGFSQRALDIIRQEISRPNGMIITTGPTGSGKSTTLYAVLKILNKPGVKIITLEDPVEYRLEGINQSQIEHEKGYTFAKGLRSILRQDPDIVMVGEIRDGETAEIAIQAALTGHLMLSTLHTNSSAGSIPRLLSMGAQSFLLAPALNCAMGQRLVRRVCSTCRKQVALSAMAPHVQERAQKNIELMPETERTKFSQKELLFYTSVGCKDCNGIGYKGRIGICEIFQVTDEIKDLILSGVAAEHEIEDHARKQGMTTMVQDGILKAAEGITTLDEIFRVID
ncbi:MAG: GspE/PulE family protein [Candidatus Magasanikbacteria bacterium]